VTARTESRKVPLATRRQRVAAWCGMADGSHRVDLRPIMELSPLAVMHTTPLPRLHHLFRQLGLRHLFVTDTRNQVVGVITRKDLLPEVLEANAFEPAPERPSEAEDGLKPILRGAKFESLRKWRTARARRQPAVPAHAHRFLRRAVMLRRALGQLRSVRASPSRMPGAGSPRLSNRFTCGASTFRRECSAPSFGRVNSCDV